MQNDQFIAESQNSKQALSVECLQEIIGFVTMHHQFLAVANAMGKAHLPSALMTDLEFSTISPLIALSCDKNFQSFAEYLTKPAPALRIIEGGRQ